MKLLIFLLSLFSFVSAVSILGSVKSADYNNYAVHDLQSLFDEQKRGKQMGRLVDSAEFKFNQYHTLKEMYELLDEFLAKYPRITEEITLGQTLEGRTIRGIKISYKAGNPGLYIESNIHARDWITSATAIWFMNELLTSQDTDVRILAENHDWYIIPVFNVDGFVYSHEFNRMWLKNRRTFNDSKCAGVDLNCNFDSHWMKVDDDTPDPCDLENQGSAAFSEPETQAAAQYISSIKNKITLFIALHAYGEYIMHSWGSSLVKPDNDADLKAVGKSFVDALAALPYKTLYTYGLSYSAGSSMDWAYDQGIQLSYTIDMRATDYYSFILPPSQILSNCQEFMSGLMAMTKKAKELGYMTTSAQ